MAIATCNTCKEFKVPWDEIGKVIMIEHQRKCNGSTHNATTRNERT